MFTITYQLDGGTLNSGAITEYETTDTSTLPGATRTGFTFIGWQSKRNTGTWQAFKTYPEGTSVNGMTGNVTFEALWKANSFPYSDDDMEYSTETHRYTLTPAYVLEETGMTLNQVLNPGMMSQPQKVEQLYLEQISKSIYKFIYSTNNENDKQEYLLAKLPSLRKIIREAMLQQVIYVLKGGDLGLYNGVNVKTGQIMDPRQLQQVRISSDAKRELDTQVPELKVAITYQGEIPIFLSKDKIRVGY